MNLSIDDVDHPLIIKVASIPTARMQVYLLITMSCLSARLCFMMQTQVVRRHRRKVNIFRRGASKLLESLVS